MVENQEATPVSKPVKTKQSSGLVGETDAPIVHEFAPMKKTSLSVNLPIILIVASIIISGGFTGYILAHSSSGSSNSGIKLPAVGGNFSTDTLKKIVGMKDGESFTDSAEGVLKVGGAADGSGTHHLERPGGISQNVYLTSSVIALDDYVDKEVQVWGETFAAESAGWFMDVGKLEVK